MMDERLFLTKLLKKGVVLVLCGIIAAAVIPVNGMTKVMAQETSAEEQCRQELATILNSDDTSKHDFSGYNMTWDQIYAIYSDLIKGECKLAYSAYVACDLDGEFNSKGMVKTVWLVPEAKVSFSDNYSKLTDAVNSIMSGMPSDASQAEKALYLHDALLERVSYKNTGYMANFAAGVLLGGYGICGGYADAYELLLNQAGIQSELVYNSASSHAWVCVDIDGSWYHVDPTWDDTGTAHKGTITHDMFLLTTSEIESYKSHKSPYVVSTGDKVEATSTTYSESYVHNVVGDMYYSDGRWYYVDGDEIKSNNMAGTEEVTVGTAGVNAKISSIKDGIVTYSCDGITQTCNVFENKMVATTQAVMVPGTDAHFFLVKEGGSRTDYSKANYYSLGDGTIKEAVKIQNDNDAVAADLLTIPDMSAYVAEGKSVVWYSVKHEKDGWHVDGEIVSDEKATIAETATSEDTEETSAKFFLVKEGGSRTDYSASNYYSIGEGTIKEAVKIQDDSDAISANLGTVPDLSTYVPEGKKVIWYSIKKVRDGWHVDGEIVNTESVQEVSVSTTGSDALTADETTRGVEAATTGASVTGIKTESSTTETSETTPSIAETIKTEASSSTETSAATETSSTMQNIIK